MLKSNLALMGIVVGCCFASCAHAVSPRGVVLLGQVARPLFKQCSRQSPSANGYWNPTNGDIEKLELLWPKFMVPQARKMKLPMKMPLQNFYRQYAGFMRNGRRVIYINAFQYPDAKWKQQAVVVCDGGPSFFGVEFDVKSQQFTNLAFNGFV